MKTGAPMRLTLTTKLLVPPVVGLVALALVAAMGYYGLRWQRLAISRIDDVRFGHLQLALEADAFAHETHQALTRRLALPPADRDPALLKIGDRELLARIRSALPTLDFLGASEQLEAKEQRSLTQTRTAVRTYSDLVEKALGSPAADANTIHAIDSQFEVLSWSLGQLVAVERELTAGAFEESGRQSRRIVVAYSVLFVLALLASLGVAVMVTRHVRSRVEAIRFAAAELAAGNPARRAEVSGEDEISETARAFNFLVDELDKAMSQLKVANRQLSGEMMAIFNASQAMSSETDLGRLKARVADLLAGITGATRVLLVSRDVTDAEGEPLPGPVLRVAEESLGPVVVEDATRDPRFSQDAHFAGLERCALLIVPIVHQGRPRAVLMLENTAQAGVFSSVRHDAVMLIARQLAISLENVRVYQDLERRVQQRTVELRAAQKELVTAAHRAGMAEVATNVLHNVGNVLNSVNVSANVIRGRIEDSRVAGLAKAVRLLDDNAANLPEFLAFDSRGKQIPCYLRELADALAHERHLLLDDAASLTRNVEHIKEIVSMQQLLAGRGNAFMELIRVDDLIEGAVHMNAEPLQDCGAQLFKQIDPLPALSLDRHRMTLILVNLIRNACQAIDATSGSPPEVKITATLTGDTALRVMVCDTGKGIAPENLARIFSHGFTTRTGGHGFGLHSCALAAVEMGGRLSVASDGVGHGATFTLEVPVDPRLPHPRAAAPTAIMDRDG
jgi:signal transduction histidine kinase/HAMP domain-containing protein